MSLLQQVYYCHPYNACERFTFHNVSITTEIRINHLQFSHNLHSTMSLLQRKFFPYLCQPSNIYIPQCLYYNDDLQCPGGQRIKIYIPQCLYYNVLCQICHQLITLFTFHNVSITTGSVHIPAAKYKHLHSTMSLLQQMQISLSADGYQNLHSTMSLLQPEAQA